MVDNATQVHENFRAFKDRHEAELVGEHLGRVALMHNGEVVDLCDDSEEAYFDGHERYGRGNFSMQEIGAKPMPMPPGVGMALGAAGR